MEPSILERAAHPISRRDIDPNVLKVLYRLINAGYVAYLVGGGVRDLLLGRRPKDFDIGTSAHPQQVRELFRNSRLVGRRFRLAHVFFGPQNIEVATFRRRSESESGDGDPLIRQDNTFGTPEEDALRRDFTVNSLFYDPQSFRVIDYVGGLDDLRAGLIRTVNEPAVRVREDPVRMIRAVRFAAKLDFEIEPETRSAIACYRDELLKASTPRLVEEIFRTFTAAPADRALLLMDELGLLGTVLPFLSDHLRRQGTALADSVTFKVLHKLSRLSLTAEPSRAFTLACLMAELHLHLAQSPRLREPASPGPRLHPPAPSGAAAGGFDLMAELRQRGFPRGETERMRLLLGALERLMRPERGRLSRLQRRPYFAEAQALFELVSEYYPSAPAIAPGPAAAPGSRRRRRRRRSRGRRPGQPPMLHQAEASGEAADGPASGASASAAASSGASAESCAVAITRGTD